MNIETYCKEQNMAFKTLADKAEISAAYVTQIIQGIRRPSPPIALRIEQATGGAVSRDELLFPELYASMTKEAVNEP